eukprot:1410003-Pleurochrysis_carterae.AAC.2
MRQQQDRQGGTPQLSRAPSVLRIHLSLTLQLRLGFLRLLALVLAVAVGRREQVAHAFRQQDAAVPRAHEVLVDKLPEVRPFAVGVAKARGEVYIVVVVVGKQIH